MNNIGQSGSSRQLPGMVYIGDIDGGLSYNDLTYLQTYRDSGGYGGSSSLNTAEIGYLQGYFLTPI